LNLFNVLLVEIVGKKAKQHHFIKGYIFLNICDSLAEWSKQIGL